MSMASLRKPADTHAPPSVQPETTLHICRENDPERAQVEAFIHAVYAQRYGAQVRHFTPVLVFLRDASGIVAAAGYRQAHASPLFLERYLDAPVETLLGAGNGLEPERKSIVEVGHLAAARAGEGRRLILLLSAHLAQQEFVWVVSTLTRELRSLFLRIGVTPVTLGVANPAALGDDAVNWGSYYEHSPLVLAGHLPQAMRRLAAKSAEGAQ